MTTRSQHPARPGDRTHGGSMSTPALARATEALPYAKRHVREAAARASVSAALHDPDDDVIARTLLAHRWDDGGYDGMGFLCICGHITGPGPDADTSWAFSVHIADAVRAAILGEVA